MKTLSALLALPIVFAGCGGQLDEGTPVGIEAVHGSQVHAVLNEALISTARRSSNLTDHGGLVVPSLKLNVIYWGSGFESSTKSLYTTFLQGLTGSGYWSINSQYLRGAANHASYGASYSDTSTPPSTVTDADLQNEVHKVLAAGHLAFSAASLYYVVTPKNVKVCAGSSCSCTSFCGYHSDYVDSQFGETLYSTIPSAAACPTSCGVFSGDGNSPNRNVEADEGVSILAHEGEETQSDAFGSAWFDRQGNENADKCAYKYGTTTTSNGAEVNQSWGGKSWLVQMNWSNQITGCAEFGPGK